MLMLPFLLIGSAIAIARWADAQRVAGHAGRAWQVSDGSKRALTGLPAVATPARPVHTELSVVGAARSQPPSIAPATSPSPLVVLTAEWPGLTEPVAPQLSRAREAQPPDVAAASPPHAAPALSHVDGVGPAAQTVTDPAAPVPLARFGGEIAALGAEALPHTPGEPASRIAMLGPETALAVRTPPDGYLDPIGGGSQCVAPPQRLVLPAAGFSADEADADAFGLELARAARGQLEDFVIYNDRYTRMKFPMGDVHPLYGVCTDVIVRAYRVLGIDLQELVQTTRAGSGDSNIDHRRVDTLRRFFALQGESLPISAFPEDYRPGDIVTYWRPQNRHSRTHIAIVSDMTAPSGRPMIIHNRGWGPQQEDGLFVDQITGHYRFQRLKTPVLATQSGTRKAHSNSAPAPRSQVIRAGLPASGTRAVSAGPMRSAR